MCAKLYLRNSDLLKQLREARRQGQVTEELGQSFLLLVHRFQSKANWYNYPKHVKDELISDAVCTLMESWYKFDESKSQNPFSYFTSVINNSFRKTINNEKQILNFQTFMTQMTTETTVASYAQHMSKHTGIERYINEPESDEE